MAVISSNALTGITTRMADNAMSAGSIVQIQSTTKTDKYSKTTGNAFTDITGMSVDITTTGSNKVLILCSLAIGSNDQRFSYINLLRGSTDIFRGDAEGSYRVRASAMDYQQDNQGTMSFIPINYLDSPGAGTHTYKLQASIQSSGSTDGFFGLNVSARDTDNSGGYDGRFASTITAMEVAV